jgi:serine/threonine protein kinase
MNLHATHHHESEPADRRGKPGSSPAVGPTGRFAYASGARPLSGYTIKRGIGHGGFGEVYFATSDAGKEVAIKLIRRNLDIELRGVTQCLNLKHPNLIALYDVKQDDEGDNWVVMELVSGESLEDLLNRSPNGLPENEVLNWIHGIGAGTAYLHDHGIVHRDLKPGNIFIDEGFIKIGDYGLSKFISCSRRSGQTGSVGTVHYMAPEIANGRYGKEIDIYALGIILYEMLTGHVPFEGESVGEILMKHLTAEPDLSKVAEPYRTIISRCLAKDLQKRFNSVNEMVAMLPPATKQAGYYVPPVPVSTPVDLNPPIDFEKATRAAPVGATPPDNAGFSLGDHVRQSFHNANDVEPIAQWVRQAWQDLTNWWTARNFQAWQKLLILAGVVFVAINTAVLWAPTLGIGGVAYLVYRAVRAVLISNTVDSAQGELNRSAIKSSHLDQLAGLKPVFLSIPKALLWLFCSGAAMTIAGETLDRNGDLLNVLNHDDALAAIPVGAGFALVGFGIIKLWQSMRKAILGPRAILPGKLYFDKGWIPWLIAAWVGAAWLIVAMDVGVNRLSDRHIPIVLSFMALIASVAATFSAIYRAAVPMALVPETPGSKPPRPPVASEPVVSRDAAAPAPPPPLSQVISESGTRKRWRKQTQRLFLKVSPRERSSQLVGSMLLSGVAAAVVGLVTMILRGEQIEPTQYAWLAATSILGSWAVLIPAKFWETRSGDVAIRRFVMLVMGLGFGLCAYALDLWLFVQLPYSSKMTRFGERMADTFYGHDGSPTSIAFLAYFGFLFVLLRWWRLADPLRATRISIWYTGVAVFWGAVLSMFWPFPQPWGLMIAATIAVSVQLAAPWISPAERAELQRKQSAA